MLTHAYQKYTSSTLTDQTRLTGCSKWKITLAIMLSHQTNDFPFPCFTSPVMPSVGIKHMSNNNLLGKWAEFTRALETRFGPFTYENHRATLFKLHQVSTVAACQSEFKKISNCVVGLPPTHYVIVSSPGFAPIFKPNLPFTVPKLSTKLMASQSKSKIKYELNFHLPMIPSSLLQRNCHCCPLLHHLPQHFQSND